MYLVSLRRAEEFSPLKNSPDSQVDSPNTCRIDLSNLHKTWIVNAGGKLEGVFSNYYFRSLVHTLGDGLCEISPLVSYFGEGLKEHVEGKTITLPFHLDGGKS
jgi:UDP-N-acetylglucosamine/UDP-N-acetylgalactosamine diphosphorylase